MEIQAYCFPLSFFLFLCFLNKLEFQNQTSAGESSCFPLPFSPGTFDCFIFRFPVFLDAIFPNPFYLCSIPFPLCFPALTFSPRFKCSSFCLVSSIFDFNFGLTFVLVFLEVLSIVTVSFHQFCLSKFFLVSSAVLLFSCEKKRNQRERQEQKEKTKDYFY